MRPEPATNAVKGGRGGSMTGGWALGGTEPRTTVSAAKMMPATARSGMRMVRITVKFREEVTE